jgi:hypothetical protein
MFFSTFLDGEKSMNIFDFDVSSEKVSMHIPVVRFLSGMSLFALAYITLSSIDAGISLKDCSYKITCYCILITIGFVCLKV